MKNVKPHGFQADRLKAEAHHANTAINQSGFYRNDSSKLQASVNESQRVQQLKILGEKVNSPSNQLSVAPGHGPVKQMVITKDALEQKLASDPDYKGTLDSTTPWHEAILVGKEWVGSIESGSITKKYGPPFNYQALSKNLLKQFRPPMVKINSKKRGEAQANFEARSKTSDGFHFNAHVTVPNIDDYAKKKNKPEEGKSEV